ncbi:TPA: hypothetical protein IXL40_003014 [Enterococcus faecium]|nr:hypothetical protein [Enterococcus faecium]HDU0590639.1 hypothetical protein [Enterococcus faecium]HDU0590942.1 hypothetical protein [Enterococcus faecium]
MLVKFTNIKKYRASIYHWDFYALLGF